MGDKNVVVQFFSLREFKKYKHIYQYELFLVVPCKELHFAVVRFGEENSLNGFAEHHRHAKRATE